MSVYLGKNKKNCHKYDKTKVSKKISLYDCRIDFNICARHRSL